MRSAGNDIVTLRSLDKQRAREFRFYSKILSAPEQVLYHRPQWVGIPFEVYVWLLWSVKESAYKYRKRMIPSLEFSPAKISIQFIIVPEEFVMTQPENVQWESTGCDKEFYRGTLIYESCILHFRSKICEHWITTVVNGDENFDHVRWGIRAIDTSGYSHQSKAARTLLLARLSPFFPGQLKVEKSPVGYPVILKGTQDMRIPASLAHDGNFVAYSFLLNFPDNN